MAYTIQYSQETSHRYPPSVYKKRKNSSHWIWLSVLILGILWLRLNGVPDFLIPGDPKITRQATAELVENLQQGNQVDDALATFCRNIVDGAGL